MITDPQAKAFQEGKQTGLAIAAIACSAMAFVSLLGIEKAALALVLAILACRGVAEASRVRRLAHLAIGIAIIYAVTFAVVLTVYHDKVSELFRLLLRMS